MLASAREPHAVAIRPLRLALCVAFLGNVLYGPAHLAEAGHLEAAHLEAGARRDPPVSPPVFTAPEDSGGPSHDPHASGDHILKAAPPRASASWHPSGSWSATEVSSRESATPEASEPTARGPPPDPPRPSSLRAGRAPGSPRAPPAV